MTVVKVCPVITRSRAEGLQILAFRHPLAGKQLVKGTLEDGEAPEDAALRELKEEAGLDAIVARPLGVSGEIAPGQSWMFYLCAAGRQPDDWTHHCADDGGHLFEFFWQCIDDDPDSDWHPVQKAALAFIRTVL